MGFPLKYKLIVDTALRRSLKPASLVFLSLGLIAISALAAGVGVDRTILVDARTRMVSVDFIGESNAWPIGGAAICVPRAAPDPTASRGNGPCDLRLFDEPTIATGFLDWGPNGRAEASLDASDGLVVRVLCSATYPSGTRVILPLDVLRNHGAFGWIGNIVLGQRARSGETGLLIGGTYEARELLRFLPRSLRTTEVTSTGPLRSGEAVHLVRRGEGVVNERSHQQPSENDSCAQSSTANKDLAFPSGYHPIVTYGHLVLENDDDQSFRVEALTAPGDTGLMIDFVGVSQPALVRPNWIDRMTSSPIVTAVATMLAVAVALLNLAVGIWQAAQAGKSIADTKTSIDERPQSRAIDPEVAADVTGLESSVSHGPRNQETAVT